MMEKLTELYIANLTNQRRDFTYRIKGEVNYRTESIGVGKQARLPASLTAEDIAYIIEQYLPYGLTAVNDLKSLKGFTGLCYSIGKPVPMDNMLYTFEHNKEVLNEGAVDRREQTAAAISAGITAKMQEHDVEVPRTEVEFTEVDGPGKIAEGYEMPAEGVAPRKATRLARKAQRARA